MEHEIFARLTPVCNRGKNRTLLRQTGRGLLVGSAIAVVLGLLNLALLTWPSGTVGPLLLKPSPGAPVRPAAEPTVRTRPVDQQPSSTSVTTRTSIAPKIRWRVAPPAEVAPARVYFPAGATLEQIASDAQRSPTTREGGPPGRDGDLTQDKRLPTVVEAEPVPSEHRETIRRYFEAIRPRQHEPPDDPAAAP